MNDVFENYIPSISESRGCRASYNSMVYDLANEGTDDFIKDSWYNDSRTQFAFTQGWNKSEKVHRDEIEYLRNRVMCEERKRKKLAEMLKAKGIEVDASGDDVIIHEWQ